MGHLKFLLQLGFSLVPPCASCIPLSHVQTRETWKSGKISLFRRVPCVRSWGGGYCTFHLVPTEIFHVCGAATTPADSVHAVQTLPLAPPPPCCSPPLVVPRRGGDRHLVNPKFFFAAHCVVVWVTVLWGTATCIPCTHGRTFCSLSLKWNSTTQPCFPLGQM